MDALILGLEERARSAGLEIDTNNKEAHDETIQDEDTAEEQDNTDQDAYKENGDKRSSRDDNGTSFLSKRIVKVKFLNMIFCLKKLTALVLMYYFES